MVLGAVVSAVGVGLNFLGQRKSSNDQSKAIEEANEKQEEIAKAQYNRALQEWELDYYQRLTNWYYERAVIDQITKNDLQSALDYYNVQAQNIENTRLNYAINRSALYDEFIVGESLRLKQELINLKYGNEILGLRASLAMSRAQTEAKRYEMQAQRTIEETENNSLRLIGEVVTEQNLVNIEYDLAMAGAVERASGEAARAGTRTGGGATADRLERAELARTGRAYEELVARQNSRENRVAVYNNYMNDVVSKQLAELAIAAQGALQAGALEASIYQAQAAQNTAIFNQVTLPGFWLAQDQYRREVAALQLQTKASLENAWQPYRLTEQIQPPMPIKGLKPDYYAPAPVYAATGNIFSSAASALNSTAGQQLISSIVNPLNTSRIGTTGSIGSQFGISSGLSNSFGNLLGSGFSSSLSPAFTSGLNYSGNILNDIGF